MADDTLDSGNDTDGGANLGGVLDGLRLRTDNLTVGANGFARAMTRAFTSSAAGGKQLDDVLRSLALRLSNLAVNAAFKPLTGGLSGLFNQGVGGLFATGGQSAGGPGLSDLFDNAQPFAAGGVVSTPTYFPMGGQLGLAGEAGAEAILPLARGPDGRLGVASGGGNVNITITTPDAESFRRSETYVAGLIARAVARGQRGL